ncbi:MAG TPA: PTS sugar transporter subunit IIA [Planctomycetota bacterium]|nr:PTS sugar transporter subunit IIA [Planctomycetota bacterium]
MQLTVREAAEYLKVSEKSIYRWIGEAKIPHHKVDGQYRFNRTELLEWANERKIKVSTAVYRRDNLDRPAPGIAESLEAGGIVHRLPGEDKAAVLRAMVDALKLPDRVDRDTLFHILEARERLGSTGVGHGIAIPHVRSPIIMSVSTPIITLFFLEHPIEFGAPDGQPVKTLICLVSPSIHLHTHMLAKIATLIRDPGFMSALERHASTEEILSEARRAEASLNVEPPGRP